ncbi:MAG: metallophosphoesterase, partial [Massilia sp.]|nr:metallophosphoesterase [Massilia sp.]
MIGSIVVRHAIAAACLLAAAQSRAAEAAYTLYVAGDIAWCGRGGAKWSGAEDTARVIEFGLSATPRAAVLTLGDNVYQHGTAAEYASCYAPTWGRFRARTFPAPGNHEHATPGAAGYFAYFGQVAGPGYYSVQLGAWHVISLDSNLEGAAQAAQLAWLKGDLEANGARC